MMNYFVNTTQVSEFEKDVIDNLQTVIIIVAVIGLCVIISLLRSFFETVMTFFHCFWYVMCCRCLRRNYTQCKDDY
jgi:hypothetical protein